MVFINPSRMTGKTISTIKESSKNKKHIICSTEEKVSYISNLAKKIGIDIPNPMTIKELNDLQKMKGEIYIG